MSKSKDQKTNGYILVTLIVLSAIAVIILVGLTTWTGLHYRLARLKTAQESAFHIAEAGINYYRWHLAHAPNDYRDGQTDDGPYRHPFINKDGDEIGAFTLTITPPDAGSHVVVVTSTGVTVSNPDVTRTVKATFAIPSLAQYAFIGNSTVRFGGGTEVFGQLHSNGGIRFDGKAHNLVTSAQEQYDDPDRDDCTQGLDYGVHTCLPPSDPSPPNAPPDRPDVFAAGRAFPTPEIGFQSITEDFLSMKYEAQNNGRLLSSSQALGYHIVLKSNDTFDLYRVTQLRSPSWWCAYTYRWWRNPRRFRQHTWSIGRESFIGNYPFPNNGLLFVEDHAWIDGAIETARLTIAAAMLDTYWWNGADITINKNITYAAYDGSAVLGLIAQSNVNVGLYSEDTLRIDAALVAQYGRIGRHWYYPHQYACGTNAYKSEITLYGMLATNQRYGFAWSDGTGYRLRNLIYDPHLLYAPPPFFPSISNQYQLLNWEEVQVP